MSDCKVDEKGEKLGHRKGDRLLLAVAYKKILRKMSTMPRTSRIVIAGYPHHIIQRSHNRQVIFASDDDCLYYIDNLRDWKEQLACKVYAYFLMTTHAHLIIDPGKEEKNLAHHMK